MAVRGLDLSIPEGSLYGFIGPNGSGKTTSLRMMLRILLPSEGVVSVLGKEQASAKDDRTGYLPEERGLYRSMRVRELLCYFAELKGNRAPGKKVDDWLERLGLADRARDKVESLSKGLAQRVQFAVAVVHDPELLVLDEPFSGLDPIGAQTLRDAILELHRRGATIVLSTHDMQLAETMCDSVLMMHGGRKVLDGTVSDIKSSRGKRALRVRFRESQVRLDGIDGIDGMTDYGKELTLQLTADAEPTTILSSLTQRGTLVAFELAEPSLHEIFVDIAGAPA